MLIFRRMWPHLGTVLKALSNPEKAKVSKHQLFVLHMIESNLEQWVKENPNAHASQLFGQPIVKVTTSISDEIAKVESVLIRLAQNGPLSPVSPLNDAEKMEAEYGWLALQVLASITAAINSSDKSDPESLRLVQNIVRTSRQHCF